MTNSCCRFPAFGATEIRNETCKSKRPKMKEQPNDKEHLEILYNKEAELFVRINAFQNYIELRAGVQDDSKPQFHP